MADILTSLLGFDQKLTSAEAPFDSLPTKRVEVGTSGSDRKSVV